MSASYWIATNNYQQKVLKPGKNFVKLGIKTCWAAFTQDSRVVNALDSSLITQPG